MFLLIFLVLQLVSSSEESKLDLNKFYNSHEICCNFIQKVKEANSTDTKFSLNFYKNEIHATFNNSNNFILKSDYKFYYEKNLSNKQKLLTCDDCYYKVLKFIETFDIKSNEIDINNYLEEIKFKPLDDIINCVLALDKKGNLFCNVKNCDNSQILTKNQDINVFKVFDKNSDNKVNFYNQKENLNIVFLYKSLDGEEFYLIDSFKIENSIVKAYKFSFGKEYLFYYFIKYKLTTIPFWQENLYDNLVFNYKNYNYSFNFVDLLSKKQFNLVNHDNIISFKTFNTLHFLENVDTKKDEFTNTPWRITEKNELQLLVYNDSYIEDKENFFVISLSPIDQFKNYKEKINVNFVKSFEKSTEISVLPFKKNGLNFNYGILDFNINSLNQPLKNLNYFLENCSCFDFSDIINKSKFSEFDKKYLQNILVYQNKVIARRSQIKDQMLFACLKDQKENFSAKNLIFLNHEICERNTKSFEDVEFLPISYFLSFDLDLEKIFNLKKEVIYCASKYLKYLNLSTNRLIWKTEFLKKNSFFCNLYKKILGFDNKLTFILTKSNWIKNEYFKNKNLIDELLIENGEDFESFLRTFNFEMTSVYSFIDPFFNKCCGILKYLLTRTFKSYSISPKEFQFFRKIDNKIIEFNEFNLEVFLNLDFIFLDEKDLQLANIFKTIQSQIKIIKNIILEFEENNKKYKEFDKKVQQLLFYNKYY